jgi:hypothetical protein
MRIGHAAASSRLAFPHGNVYDIKPASQAKTYLPGKKPFWMCIELSMNGRGISFMYVDSHY